MFLMHLYSPTPLCFTSTGIHLKLTVNVALVHERMKNIEDAVHVPDLWVVSQEFNLLL